MDLLESELETGRDSIKFLLIKNSVAFVGSHLFLLAVMRGTVRLSPFRQGCKMAITVGFFRVTKKAGGSQPQRHWR